MAFLTTRLLLPAIPILVRLVLQRSRSFFSAGSGLSSDRACSARPLRAVAISDLVGLAILTIGLRLRLLLLHFGPLPIHLRLIHDAAVDDSGLVVVAVLDLDGSLSHVDLLGLDRLLKLPKVFITMRKVAAVA